MQEKDKLSPPQLALLDEGFQQGSVSASQALSQWIGKACRISNGKLEQLSLTESVQLFGSDLPLCLCRMTMSGHFTGHIVLVCNDESGLAAARLLMDSPADNGWDDMAKSALLETANIVSCAYLGALARFKPLQDALKDLNLSPPVFVRDYAGCLLQFALVDQTAEDTSVILNWTEFHLHNEPIHWTLLLVPDMHGMQLLRQSLQP